MDPNVMCDIRRSATIHITIFLGQISWSVKGANCCRVIEMPAAYSEITNLLKSM